MEFGKAASRNDLDSEQKASSSTANAAPARVSMSRLGQLEPYDEATNDWPLYEERLTSYLQVNQVAKDAKLPAFPSLIGPKSYAPLKSLSGPELPSARMLESLKSSLRVHLAPQTSVIAEQAKFYMRSQ